VTRRSGLGAFELAALLVATACAPEAPGAPAGLSEADHTAMHQLTDDFGTKAVAKDFNALSMFYTEDAVVMPPNEAAVTGRAAIKTWFEALPPLTAFKLTEVSSDGVGDLGYVHGTYEMTFTLPDSTVVTDHGKYVEVRRRQADGSWLISHDIFNTDMPMPTGAP
jgi:ketosteroid isomerase-like protein